MSSMMRLLLVISLLLLSPLSADKVVGQSAPGLGEWTVGVGAPENEWNSVCYGNGIFVAVSSTGTGNRVMTSADGMNWTARPVAVDREWRSVCFGNGLFVAVANTGVNNRVMTSPDGINWTPRDSLGGIGWLSVCYGKGMFVAVGANSVMTSLDGINWSVRQLPGNNNWYSVCYGNGKFVAVSSTGTGNSVMTSSDGINWSADWETSTGVPDYGWTSVCFGNGTFVAVSLRSYANNLGSGHQAMTSTDGTNWTIRTTPVGDYWWRSVCYGNGLFVAVGASGTIDGVMTSADGINWTIGQSAVGNIWNSVCYGNGKFVAVGNWSFGNPVMSTVSTALPLGGGGYAGSDGGYMRSERPLSPTSGNSSNRGWFGWLIDAFKDLYNGLVTKLRSWYDGAFETIWRIVDYIIRMVWDFFYYLYDFVFGDEGLVWMFFRLIFDGAEWFLSIFPDFGALIDEHEESFEFTMGLIGRLDQFFPITESAVLLGIYVSFIVPFLIVKYLIFKVVRGS
jgi:hypothetical protein